MFNDLKTLSLDPTDFSFLTLVYDDPYNLENPSLYRISCGFLMKKHNKVAIEKLTKKERY